jgi:hypothetical protein
MFWDEETSQTGSAFELCSIRFGYSVAGWYIFKPKIPVRANLEGLAMEYDGIFYVHFVYFLGQMVYFMSIWYFFVW